MQRRPNAAGVSPRLLDNHLAHYVIRVARNAGIVALFIVAAMLGLLSGVLFAYAGDLPADLGARQLRPEHHHARLRDQRPDDRRVRHQRRLVIGYDDIAPRLRQAIISAEDGDFERHFGLSISSIAITVTRDIFQGMKDMAAGRPSRPAGASTLTQQLARNILPEAVGFKAGDVSLERKIKEAIVAVQIEKRYTKREILTLYANHILFGHGTYGVEAAARLYFGRSAKEVTLEEAALLAGIIQAPARQSPFVNMEAAVRRRNYALQRMVDEGYIPQGGSRHREAAADCRPRPAAAATIGGAVFRRRSPQASRTALRREGAVRERAVGENHARCHAAGGRESRRRARTAAARQAPRLSAPEAQRAGRGAHDRQFQG